MAVDEVALAGVHPLAFVYLIVTVLLPVVNHFKVTVLLPEPVPPEVMV